jgi:hypothetical protein
MEKPFFITTSLKLNALENIMSPIYPEDEDMFVYAFTYEPQTKENIDALYEEYNQRNNEIASHGSYPFENLKKIKKPFKEVCNRSFEDFLGDGKYSMVTSNIHYDYSIVERDNTICYQKNTSCPSIYEYNTKKHGKFLCMDNGEFMGNMFHEDNGEWYRIGCGNYFLVAEVGDKLYAFETLSHMGSETFGIYEIQLCEGCSKATTLFYSSKVAIKAYYFDEACSRFYFSDGDNLFSLDLQTMDEIKFIQKLSSSHDISSILIKDGMVYVGCSFYAMKYDLNKDEVEYYSDLKKDEIKDTWYCYDMKFLDIYDKIVG